MDWGTITTTAAVFQIARPSLITTPANVRAYDGEQQNSGVELNAYGLLLPGLRGMASAMFLRPELTKSNDATDIGKDAAGTPDKTFSAGLDWDAPWVPGLAFNGRVIYTSGSYLTTANTVRFDDWTRLDIGARYTTTALNGKPVTFRANIENADRRDVLAHQHRWHVRDGRRRLGPTSYRRHSISDRMPPMGRRGYPENGLSSRASNIELSEIAGACVPAIFVAFGSC